MKAASERDLERVGRTVIATLWLVMGQLWFGYEVHGLDNLPPDGKLQTQRAVPFLHLYFTGQSKDITLHYLRYNKLITSILIFAIS